VSVRLLVVEDDADLRAALVAGLRHERFAVDPAGTLAAAAELAAATAYDVACLDLGLPDGDGLVLCRRLRAGDGVRAPGRILALTARDAVVDRVAGLDAGADDYLVKPFAFAELVARLRALTRRREQVGEVLRVADLEIDVRRHRTRRGGRDVALTGREFAVLRYLAQRAGEVVSAEDLLEHCWDVHADPFTSSPRVIVARVRRKLGDPPLLYTRIGAGYRLGTWP
jgi:DNA-binding response OmpR family regulator